MKSITIHKLDDSLETLFIERAKSEGQSLNKIIKKLLAEAAWLFLPRVTKSGDANSPQ